MSARFRIVPAVFALALAGCAAVDPGPAFQAVQGDVAARTGQRVAWSRGGPEDREAERAVRDLLQKPLTAAAAVQVALLNNPGLQASFEEVGISQADLVQAGLLKNPSFSALIRFPNTAPLGADQEFSVTQDFFDLLILPLRKRMAALALEETELRIGQEAVALAADVKAAFYTLQARAELLARLELVADLDRAAAAFARKQHEAGNINDLDLENQLAEANAMEAALAEARIAATRDREALNRLLGWDAALPAWTPVPRLAPVPAERFSEADLEARARAQRLDLAAAAKRVALLQKALGVQDATRFFPGGINVGADTEKNPDRSRVTGPSIDVELPVFDQGEAKVARLQAQLRQAQDRQRALQVAADSEIREAVGVLDARRGMAQSYRDTLLPQRARILQLSQEQYNYMLKGTYDLLLAKQREVETERAAIEAARDYWIARAALERALGGVLPVPASVPMPSSTPTPP